MIVFWNFKPHYLSVTEKNQRSISDVYLMWKNLCNTHIDKSFFKEKYFFMVEKQLVQKKQPSSAKSEKQEQKEKMNK